MRSTSLLLATLTMTVFITPAVNADSLFSSNVSTRDINVSSSPSHTPPMRPTRGGPVGLEAALAACRASVSTDANGRPKSTAIDSCLSAKGFSKQPPLIPLGISAMMDIPG